MIVCLSAEFAALENHASVWQTGIIVAGDYGARSLYCESSGPVVAAYELTAGNGGNRIVCQVKSVESILVSFGIYGIILPAAYYCILAAFNGDCPLYAFHFAILILIFEPKRRIA